MRVYGCPDPYRTTCRPELDPPGGCPEAPVTPTGEAVDLFYGPVNADTILINITILTDEARCEGGGIYEGKRRKQVEIIRDFRCQDP